MIWLKLKNFFNKSKPAAGNTGADPGAVKPEPEAVRPGNPGNKELMPEASHSRGKSRYRPRSSYIGKSESSRLAQLANLRNCKVSKIDLLELKKVSDYQDDLIGFCNKFINIPGPSGIQRLKLWAYQEEILREAVVKNSDGKNKYGTIAICLPKRNGKTFLASLIITWRFVTGYNIQGIIASNSREQASSILFDTIKQNIRLSPELLNIVGKTNIQEESIRIPEKESRLMCLSSNKSTAWGYGLDIAGVDEIHASPDDEGLYSILASQTGDRGGLVILPSQVSGKLNILYKLYELSLTNEDPTIYFKYVCNQQLSPLITEAWLNSRQKQLTPQQFNMYHLNLFQDSTSNLFPENMINEVLTDEI